MDSQDPAIEFRYQTEDVVVVCSACGASSAEALEISVLRLASCPLCARDIEEDGELTGVGDAVLSGLSRRFGAKRVLQTWRTTIANVRSPGTSGP